MTEQERIAKLQAELAQTAIPGGMMGGYNEEGFPFYFINRKMLDYLGYEKEADFVRDIDGLVSNCIHPEDRGKVDVECAAQLKTKGGYELEYRMRRSDGTYIWVHDLGKTFVTGDGREAILSVCYDITGEKEQNAFLQSLVDSMNGSMGVYALEGDGKLVPMFISGSMGRMIHMSKQEYLRICGGDAMDCIYPADRQRVHRSILESVYENKPTAISFRAITGDGGYTWLNGSYSRAGEVDGKPTLRVVFTPVTAQFALQEDVIHHVPGGVCLYKWQEGELLPLVISNQFARLHGGEEGEGSEQISAVDFEYVHPDDLPGYQDFIRQIVAQPGRERTHTFRFWNLKENRYVWICVNTTDLLQADGSQLIYATYSNVDQIKEAEEKLRRNEEMLEQTCEFAGVWTFFYNVQTKVVYPGKSLQAAFGFGPEEPDFPECIIRTGFIPQESVQVYRDMIRQVDRGREGVQTDIRVQYAPGEEHWLRYDWKIIEYREGKPYLAIGYARGVDQETQLKARIKMEQERLLGGDGRLLAYVVSNITTGIVVEQKTFLDQTPIAHLGGTLEEGAALAARDIVDPVRRQKFVDAHKPRYLADLYAAGRTSGSMEYRRRQPSGTLIWEKAVMNILREPESGNLFLYEYCYDISKERLLEEMMIAAVNYDYERISSINLAEDRIDLLLPDPITNDYQLKQLCYSELCHRYASQNVMPEDRELFLGNTLPQGLAERMESTGAFEFMHREMGADGEIRYKLDRHAYYDRARKICLLTRSDITETVKREEEKQQELQRALQKERAAAQVKSNFLSRMSHELRTPLNAISGYTALLEQSARADTADRTEELRQLEAIQSASKYLLSIIGDLLDRQKIEAGQITLNRERVNAEDYMRQLVTMIRPEADHKKLNFTYERLTHMSEFYTLDGVRLQQVLLNILHNAIKFTPEGGAVKMTAEVAETTDTGVVLRFVVADTGIGMSRDFMENHLYQAFSQENQGMTSPYEGTGIGLSISRELVHLMGGEIACQSEKGRGTTFTVTVRAEKEQKPRQTRAHRERTPVHYDLGGLRVLVCEDNPMNQDMTRRLLTRMNCRVEVADDGQIGVDKFGQSPEGYFDLVLMDLRMPQMDGFEAARTIRALPRGDAATVPILALSANAFEEDVRQTLAAGMNEHLAKPAGARLLYDKLRQYCRCG